MGSQPKPALVFLYHDFKRSGHYVEFVNCLNQYYDVIAYDFELLSWSLQRQVETWSADQLYALLSTQLQQRSFHVLVEPSTARLGWQFASATKYSNVVLSLTSLSALTLPHYIFALKHHMRQQPWQSVKSVLAVQWYRFSHEDLSTWFAKISATFKQNVWYPILSQTIAHQRINAKQWQQQVSLETDQVSLLGYLQDMFQVTSEMKTHCPVQFVALSKCFYCPFQQAAALLCKNWQQVEVDADLSILQRQPKRMAKLIQHYIMSIDHQALMPTLSSNIIPFPKKRRGRQLRWLMQ